MGLHRQIPALVLILGILATPSRPLQGAGWSPGERLPPLILSEINRLIAGRIRVRDLSWRVPNTIVAKGITILDPQGALLATIDGLEASLDVGALAGRTLRITKLPVQGLKLKIINDAQGLNLLRTFASNSKASDDAPLKIVLDGISTQAASVIYQGGDISLAVGDVDLSAALNFDGKHLAVQAPMQAKMLVLKVGELKFRAENLRAKNLHVDENGLRLSALNFLLQGQANKLSGSLLWKPEAYKLDGTLRLPAGYWPEGLAKQEVKFGAVLAQLKLRGALSKPRVEARINDLDLVAAGQKFFAQSVLAVVTTQSLSLNNLAAKYAGGDVSGDLTYKYKSAQLSGALQAQDLRLRQLSAHENLRGRVSGALQVSGPVTGKPALALDFSGSTKHLDLGSVGLDKRHLLRVKALWQGESLRLDQVKLNGSQLDLKLSGSVGINNKRLDLDLVANSPTPANLLKEPVDNLQLGASRFSGKVQGPFAKLVIDGALRIDTAEYSGVSVQTLQTRIGFAGQSLQLQNLDGVMGSGRLRGDLVLGFDKSKSLTGSLQLAQAQIAELGQLSAERFVGHIDLSARLSGQWTKPRVDMSVLAQDLAFGGDKAYALQGLLRLQDRQLELSNLSLSPTLQKKALLTAEAKLNLDDKAITGALHVLDADMQALPLIAQMSMQGRLSGSLALAGDIDKPKLLGSLDLLAAQWMDSELGSGLVNVCWRGDDVKASILLADDVSVADPCTPRPSSRERLWLGLSYQLSGKSLDLDSKIRGFALGPFIDRVESLRGIIGEADLDFQAKGPVDQLQGLGQLRLHGLHNGIAALGTASIDLRLAGRQIKLGVKGLGSLKGSGILDLDDDATRFVGAVQLDQFAPLPWLSQLRHQAVEAKLDGQVSVRYDSALASPLQVDIPLQKARVVVEKEQAVVLSQPTLIQVKGDRVQVDKIVLSQGKAQVTAGGFYSPQDIDLSVDGELALAIVQALSSEVSRAQGLCHTALAIHGSAEQPQISGFVEPLPGAQLTVRSLGQPLDFIGGRLLFSQDAIGAENFAAKGLGGNLLLRGEVKLVDARPQFYDLQLRADNIFVRQDPVRGELSGDLALRGEASSPTLSGRISMVDGRFFERYQLRNFVAAPSTVRDQRTLAQRFPSLAATQFDVELEARDLRAHADMGSVVVDLSGGADLSLAGTLQDLEVGGAVDVEEGRVKVLESRLDVENASVDFPARADRRIVPRIALTARSIIPPASSPTGAELPVVLTLSGDVEQMRLDLETEESSEQISRAELITLLATGRPVGELLGQTSGDAAMRLVSREIFSEVERQVEDTLNDLGRRRGLGAVDLIIESGTSGARTGLRWEWDQRLQFEGETTVSYFDSEDPAAGNGVVAAGTLRHALRARWLISDNIPIADSLAFEADLSNLSTAANVYSSVDLKLTMRIFEL